MNDTVVIVTGAAPLDARAVAAIPSHAIVIAADGGLDHARAAGLTPAGLIGDLDSVSEEGLAWAKHHATIQRHPIDKDATDTELAVAFAAGMNPSRVVMVAGGGDRLDHTLAAIGALGAPRADERPPHRVLVGRPVPPGRPRTGPGLDPDRRRRSATSPGTETRISLLAMHGPCTGVTLSGTRWPLERTELRPLVGHGLSNVATGPDVESRGLDRDPHRVRRSTARVEEPAMRRVDDGAASPLRRRRCRRCSSRAGTTAGLDRPRPTDDRPRPPRPAAADRRRHRRPPDAVTLVAYDSFPTEGTAAQRRARRVHRRHRHRGRAADRRRHRGRCSRRRRSQPATPKAT